MAENEELIQKIRQKFLIESERNEQLYHEVDVQRVRTDDWQIERFVVNNQKDDRAYELLLRALQWKKSFGIHERTDNYFPIEYYENSETHSYGRDKEGRLIQWEMNKNERKIPELNLLTKQFIAHIIEKIDVDEGRSGFTLINDTNGAGISNVNMEIFKFKIEINDYYPDAMKSILVVDLPLILSRLARVILSLCDQKLRERTHFVKRKDLTKYMDQDLIPIQLDGKRVPNIVIPEGLQNMKQLSTQLGLSDKVIKTYYKSFDKKYKL